MVSPPISHNVTTRPTRLQSNLAIATGTVVLSYLGNASPRLALVSRGLAVVLAGVVRAATDEGMSCFWSNFPVLYFHPCIKTRWRKPIGCPLAGRLPLPMFARTNRSSCDGACQTVLLQRITLHDSPRKPCQLSLHPPALPRQEHKKKGANIAHTPALHHRFW